MKRILREARYGPQDEPLKAQDGSNDLCDATPAEAPL